MTVYGYCRVSTEQQAQGGHSLTDQRRRITSRAAEHDWPLAQIFVEGGVSGGMPWRQRPEGSKLFALLQAGDVIFATTLDRCFRNTRDALQTIQQLRQRGIRFFILNLGEVTGGDAMAEMLVTVLVAVAEFERELTRERILAVKAHLRSQGKVLSGQPRWGFRKDEGGYEVPIPEQQLAIDYMQTRRRAGASKAAIQREVLARYGFKISHGTINRIVDTEPAKRGEKPSPRAVAAEEREAIAAALPELRRLYDEKMTFEAIAAYARDQLGLKISQERIRRWLLQSGAPPRVRSWRSPIRDRVLAAIPPAELKRPVAQHALEFRLAVLVLANQFVQLR
jgi:putative DNA-invertase from lambdoid prophage Rac